MTVVPHMIDSPSTDPERAPTAGVFAFLRAHPEAVSLILLVAICASVALINPAFLQPSSLIDMGRASVVTGLFALGVFTVLASGGIDVSFPAVGAVAMYGISTLVLNVFPGMPMALIVVLCVATGIVLGMFTDNIGVFG